MAVCFQWSVENSSSVHNNVLYFSNSAELYIRKFHHLTPCLESYVDINSFGSIIHIVLLSELSSLSIKRWFQDIDWLLAIRRRDALLIFWMREFARPEISSECTLGYIFSHNMAYLATHYVRLECRQLIGRQESYDHKQLQLE